MTRRESSAPGRQHRLDALYVLGGLTGAAAPAMLVLAGIASGPVCIITPPLAFGAINWLLPAARPNRAPTLSPRNVVWAAFALQLVVAPLLVALFGVVEWVFPVPQTWGAIAGAALLSALSYLCWALGVVLFERTWPRRRPVRLWGPIPGRVILLFGILGGAGIAALLLRAGTGAGSPQNAVGPTFATVGESEQGGLQITHLVLRPFLAVAGVALLSNAVARRAQSGGPAIRRYSLAVVPCVLLVFLAYTTTDLRRAPLLAALVGLASACALITRRPSFREVVWLGAIAIVGFFAIRILRSPDASFGTLFSSSGEARTLADGINTEVQSYGGGLQMIAFLLDHMNVTPQLNGLGQAHAALSPVPRLGAPLRDSTPAAFYNALFINRTDQTLPLVGQLYLDFGVYSVAIGFTVLGGLTQALERAFERSGTVVQAFVWAVPGAWLAFSLCAGPAGLYQALLFFSLPSYILLVVMTRRRKGPSPSATL